VLPKTREAYLKEAKEKQKKIEDYLAKVDQLTLDVQAIKEHLGMPTNSTRSSKPNLRGDAPQ
jgi:hypothetical protein